MTIPKERQRAKRPKTRTGCRTCRKRHVKCDESAFPCVRCVKSGRICDGYEVPTKFCYHRAGNTTLLPKSINLPLASPRAPETPEAFSTWTASESMAFDYFRREALWQLPGSSLDWSRLILQATYDESALTHGALAIGFLCLHQRDMPSNHYSLKEERHDLALSHYSRAIRHLDRYIASLDRAKAAQGVEVILLVSLFFFCFEIMSGEDLHAVMHFRTGLRILYESLQQPQQEARGKRRMVVMRPAPRNNMDLLLNTFVRLDSDTTLTEDYSPYLYPTVDETIPTYFASLEAARIHLIAISTATYGIFHELDELGRADVALHRDITNISDEGIFILASAASRLLPSERHPDLCYRMREAQRDLAAWSYAFALLPHQTDPAAAPLVLELKIEYLDLWINTCIWKDENEAMADRMEAQFAHLILLAEQYVTLQLEPAREGHSETNTRRAFPLGTRLVCSIAGMSWKCRVPALRRRCIDLIRRINLEGISDSEYLAAVCEKVMDIEELQACELHNKSREQLVSSDIPDHVRILELEMCKVAQLPESRQQSAFWKLDTGRIVYVTAPDVHEGGLKMHEALFTIPRAKELEIPWSLETKETA